MPIRFGPFLLDRDARQLTRQGREIHLAPKALDLLTALIDARPKALSKLELQEQLWPGTFVVEANVSNLVAEIREALGDRGRNAAFIRTVHGFGYAFKADAVEDAAAGAPPRCWLEWGSQRFRLAAGEYLIGRDPNVAVRLDARTVSRHHARLTVTLEGVTLEDLDSKNGTFRGNDRVRAPVRLEDGDLVRIGALSLTFGVDGPQSTITCSQVADEAPS
jgi:DNA-binding winged helix-turn-helix (wHTH) protein